jgi:type IV pilus assembly protein PilY1
VVGTGGAGGRNIFAIRVPVRSNGDANTAYPPGAQDILWEVNSEDSNFADLGHVLQKPGVGMMRDGTWVVMVGNGYVNSDGVASLYIINALTGAFIKSIPVPSTGNNGLGGVRLLLDLERQIVAAYAGDLQGNLWKFDFSSASANDWGIAFGGKPLFKAKYAKPAGATTIDQAQPITAAPAYLAHPLGGNLLVFGTGKLFETADASNTNVQTLYAVWDKVITGQASGVAAAVATRDSPTGDAIVLSRSLVEQTMTEIIGTNYYSATNNLVNYPGQRGWFIKLNMNPSGLRLIFPPQLAVGKVFLQTLAPPGNTTDPCAELRGKTVSFIVNPFSGSASAPTFDVNNDGKIDLADTSYASNPINATAVASDDTSNASFSQKVGAGVNTGVLSSATGQKTVTGAKNALRRTWRQIIRRPNPG